MATLSSAIVKQQVASMHDVEEALARQVLYGGDLATNLLETASISEARLTAVIAQCHGMAPAPAGQLPRPSPGTLRLVPGEIAIRHGIFPIGERPGELWVAVAEPIPAEVESDLTFAHEGRDQPEKIMAGEIMRSPVITLPDSARTGDVVRAMTTDHISSVVITGDQGIKGIITRDDIIGEVVQ